MTGGKSFTSWKQLIVSLIFLNVTTGEDIDFPWCIPIDSFEVQNAKIGDTVLFKWDDMIPHNVLIYPSGECDDAAGANFLGPNEDGSYVASHTFTSEDVGTVTFVCGVSGHCDLGQKVLFNVVTEGDVVYSRSNPCDSHNHDAHSHGGQDHEEESEDVHEVRHAPDEDESEDHHEVSHAHDESEDDHANGEEDKNVEESAISTTLAKIIRSMFGY